MIRFSVSILLMVFLLPCEAGTMRLVVANTAFETGLITELVRTFESENPGDRILVTNVGALVALDRGREGEADAVITHHPYSESVFISEGFGTSRTLIFYNNFALFGPLADPLNIQTIRDPRDVFRKLAEHEVPFLTPGHRSGTYRRLQELWGVAGIQPDWIGYETTDSSARTTFLTASRFESYVFGDVGTFLTLRNEIGASLVPLFRDHKALRNYYSYIPVNPEKIAGINATLARRFLDFLVSDRIQEQISRYGENTFSTSIYFSAAHLDQGLRAQKIQAKLDQQKRITNLLAAGFAGAMAFIIIIGFLYQRTRKLERLRRFNEQRFQLSVAGTNDGIFDCDYHSGQFFFSPLMQTLLGNPDLTDKQSIDAVIDEVIHPADRTATMKTIRAYIAAPGDDYLDTEFRILRNTANGAEMWARLRGKAILAPDGSAQRISGSLSDTSKIHLQEAAIRHQSLHDALTGLPNRTLLIDRLEQAVGQAHRIKGQFALMVMDLDRFKHINDTLGHAVGDQIIQQVGSRLHAVLRDTDTVSRLGGDEFAMLLPLTSEPQAKHVARKILLALKRTFEIEEHNLVVDGSIGVATYPLNGSSAEEILRHADVAMYQAKSSGEAVAFYEHERDPNSVRLLALENDLRNAIQNDSLELQFQPKVDLRKKVIIGSEALVRWTHTELGAIPPIEIIEIAERTGLIRPLTRWVLMAALRQAAHWASLGIDIPIAVNLSIWDMQDPDFVEYVREGLRKWNRVPENIEFEITESVMMVDPNRAIMALTRLSKMGIKLAVDDFGTGFSSLAYLKKFPVSTLKIDKSFVIDMMNDPSDRAIVKSTLELAHHMGISAVAEGVEDAEILNELARLGCDTAQGYFIAKPMPPGVFVNWLRESVWGLDSVLPQESFVTAEETSLH